MTKTRQVDFPVAKSWDVRVEHLGGNKAKMVVRAHFQKIRRGRRLGRSGSSSSNSKSYNGDGVDDTQKSL